MSNLYTIINNTEYRLKQINLVYEIVEDIDQFIKTLTLNFEDSNLKDIFSLGEIESLSKNLLIYKNGEEYLDFSEYNFAHLDFYETPDVSETVLRFNYIEKLHPEIEDEESLV